MSDLEHYFENLLLNGQDVAGDLNKNALSQEQQEAVEVCVSYVLYSIFNGRDDLLSYMKKDDEHADRTISCTQELLDSPNCRFTWHPVTEAPRYKVGDEGYNGYLVYANGYYEVADYTTEKFDNVPYFHVDGEYEPDVTHWMPLPQPPKENGKSET